ncbi:hypothetical protein [Mucilaginibacter sp.]|uniref:hypothetical protein n=1 Tax=Mucilaginibacter sp. TaxID=1882438 RepID=UPI003D0E72A4
MNYKEILQKLPGTWAELKLKDYIKLSPVIQEPEEDVLPDPDIFTNQYLTELDKNVHIISLLTDVPVEEIEKLTMVQLDEAVNKISFISTAPEQVKTQIKYKQFSELSYDNFITFQKLSLDFTPEKILSSAINNLPLMLSVFSKDNLKEDYFLELSIPEIITGFFFVNLNIQKYLKRLVTSSYKQLMKAQIQTGKRILTRYWQNHNPLKKSSTRIGTTG